ncbi:MAG: PilZ domain-containing protein [Candidatus Omnitrophota bacterium]
MWNGINRRKFPRINYKCIITIKSVGEIPKIITTHTENVGMGGICVMLRDYLDLFKMVELEVLFENGSGPLRCNGSVVWVVKKSDPTSKDEITYDTGIEFVDLNQANKTRIGNIVEKILSTE